MKRSVEFEKKKRKREEGGGPIAISNGGDECEIEGPRPFGGPLDILRFRDSSRPFIRKEVYRPVPLRALEGLRPIFGFLTALGIRPVAKGRHLSILPSQCCNHFLRAYTEMILFIFTFIYLINVDLTDVEIILVIFMELLSFFSFFLYS